MDATRCNKSALLHRRCLLFRMTCTQHCHPVSPPADVQGPNVHSRSSLSSDGTDNRTVSGLGGSQATQPAFSHTFEACLCL